MEEYNCPLCGETVKPETWESGDCPNDGCPNTYWWECDFTNDDDHWDYLAWEFV